MKRWIYRNPLSETQQPVAETLAQQLNLNPFLAQLLVQRGIDTFDEAKAFFRPELSQLHDPFLMADMQKAVDRLNLAIDRKEKILVYGDYDVDGTTSVAMFYGFLSRFYDQLEHYIPDRYVEGYGVSSQGVEWARDHGYSLIVALDCGIKSVDKVQLAAEYGIDFIICDHHRPGSQLPAAVAVLDPKRADCAYPYKELTGCGVGFKLLHAFCLDHHYDLELLYQYLDLLVVSIACDIVHITGENRVMAHYGLKRLNAAPRTGLKALAQVAGFTKKMDIMNVVFGLGPRINAAGRIAHARQAVNLLLCEDDAEAADFSFEINKHNLERRTFDSSITDEAIAMIEENQWLQAASSTVLFKPTWHKGVVGIVASRCIERYHRPTIILTLSHDKAAGSARSVPGFDVYDAIEACADLLEQFGGHTFAAGLTMPLENVDAFRIKFDEVVAKTILPEQLTPMIDIDLELNLAAITPRFFGIINQMQPFGPQNMTPVFSSGGVMVAGKPTIMKEKHLKIEVYQTGTPVFTAVGFSMAHHYADLMTGKPFAICYSIEENDFRGQKTLQLMLKDIRFE